MANVEDTDDTDDADTDADDTNVTDDVDGVMYRTLRLKNKLYERETTITTSSYIYTYVCVYV